MCCCSLMVLGAAVVDVGTSPVFTDCLWKGFTSQLIQRLWVGNLVVSIGGLTAGELGWPNTQNG